MSNTNYLKARQYKLHTYNMNKQYSTIVHIIKIDLLYVFCSLKYFCI